jgi:hypothetical protein
VGQFASPEEATAAADELLKLMNDVAQWGKDYHQARKQVEAKESDPGKRKVLLLEAFPDSAHQLPKPEREFSEKYNIEWETQSILDWVVGYHPVTDLVKVVSTDVFVTNNRETWLKPNCILASVIRLGARIGYCQQSDWCVLGVFLTCQAQDEPTAESIVNTIEKHLKFITDIGDRHMPDEEWNKLVQPAIDWLPPNTDSDIHFLFELLDGYGVQRTEMQIKANFQFYNVGFGLPAFIAWLEHSGCSDIADNLKEGPEWDYCKRRRKKWPKS